MIMTNMVIIHKFMTKFPFFTKFNKTSGIIFLDKAVVSCNKNDVMLIFCKKIADKKKRMTTWCFQRDPFRIFIYQLCIS